MRHERMPTDDDIKKFFKRYKQKRQRRYSEYALTYNIDLDELTKMVRAIDAKEAAGKRVKKRHEKFLNADFEASMDTGDRGFKKHVIANKWAEQDLMCACCKTIIGFEKAAGDHIIPHSRGGPTALWNLQVLCGSCNLEKSAKDPIIWGREKSVMFSDDFIDRYYAGVIEDGSGRRTWEY